MTQSGYGTVYDPLHDLVRHTVPESAKFTDCVNFAPGTPAACDEGMTNEWKAQKVGLSYDLEHAGGKLSCVVTAVGFRVIVSFQHRARGHHAIAEAARLYAMVMDTMGDLEGGAGDPIRANVRIEGASVDLQSASDADLLCLVSPHFGGALEEAS